MRVGGRGGGRGSMFRARTKSGTMNVKDSRGKRERRRGITQAGVTVIRKRSRG